MMTICIAGSSTATAPSHQLWQKMKMSGQRLAALEGRLDEGVADEAAERLDLGRDHGRDLGLP
jgi:hypothetical protein